MPSTALYTDVGKVAQALAFQSPETLNSNVSALGTSIVLSQAPPSDWQVGTQLLVDANNSSLREVVTMTAPPNGSTITVTALTNNHVAGVPIINISVLSTYVSAASRWFDSLTYTPAGFAYEEITETKDAWFDNNGFIVIPLSKPVVKLSDITSATYQYNPVISADNLDLTKAWVIDNYILKAASAIYYANRIGISTVTYLGGYSTIPDDIVLAVTMLAARLYKERDSGYSDTVGSAELGVFQYKRAIPADILAIVQKYRRWTV